jgi:hypothetical protein
VYYDGDAGMASKLLILEGGLYSNDWSAFGELQPVSFPWDANGSVGAFVAAPFGGLLWAFGACGLRIGFLFVMAKVMGHRFDALDRPIPQNITRAGAFDERENDTVLEGSTVEESPKGKFF